MKLIAAVFFVVTMSLSAFAQESKVCFKNDGVYIAFGFFEVYSKSQNTWRSQRFDDVLIGQEVCTKSTFNPANGDKARITVRHHVFIGVVRDTCSYENIKESRVIVANGTTLNYWCHDARIED